jgi:hypothetical protein
MPEGMYKYKEILDTITKDILDAYLKGEKALNVLIDEEVANFRDALLQAINGFDKRKGEVEKKADMPSGEYAWCPVDPTRIKVYLFRGICQDWQEIPQCFHGLCGFFPVFDKTPVTNVKLNPKDKRQQDKTKTSVIEDEVAKMLDELEKRGVTSMAEKFRILRNSFLEKLGVDKLRDLIKKTLKRGSEMERVIKKSDYTDENWQVELYDLIKSGNVKSAKCIGIVKGAEYNITGEIKGVKTFRDGSYLVIVEKDGEQRAVLPEHVIEVVKWV